MLMQLAITVAGLAILMGGWLLVQRLVRITSPEVSEEADVLESMWGCNGCVLTNHCSKTTCDK